MPDLEVRPLSVNEMREGDEEVAVACETVSKHEPSIVTSPALDAFLRAGPPQLLVTDVDGTLLDPNHNLTDRTATALRNLVKKGIPVVLATGKTFESTRVIRERIGLDSNERCVSIHVNGLVIHDHGGDVISEKALSTDVALRVLRACWAAGQPAILYSGSRILSREHNDLTAVMPQYHEAPCEIRPGLEGELEAGEHVVHKVLVMAKPADIPQVRVWLESSCLVGEPAQFTQAVSDQLELMPLGENKAVALRRVCAMLNVDIGRVVAVGDGENDKEMLAAAGLGCAMGNASPLALKAADIVLESNANDGLGRLAERLIL